MIQYKGIDFPTISATPGAGAPGTVVNVSGTGTFSYPYLINGNDPLSSAELSIGIQSNRDAINWCADHIIDWANGGNYSTWTAAVSLGSVVTWTGLQTITGALAVNGGATFSTATVTFQQPHTISGTDVTIEPGTKLLIPSGGSEIDVGSGGAIKFAVGALLQVGTLGTVTPSSVTSAACTSAAGSGEVVSGAAFNIASITLSGSTQVIVDFTVALSSVNYSVYFFCGGLVVVSIGKLTTGFTVTGTGTNIGQIELIVVGGVA